VTIRATASGREHSGRLNSELHEEVQIDANFLESMSALQNKGVKVKDFPGFYKPWSNPGRILAPPGPAQRPRLPILKRVVRRRDK
jgi:hypothetical protein